MVVVIEIVIVIGILTIRRSRVAIGRRRRNGNEI
jgi:Tfp pilus assembly protein PilX